MTSKSNYLEDTTSDCTKTRCLQPEKSPQKTSSQREETAQQNNVQNIVEMPALLPRRDEKPQVRELDSSVTEIFKNLGLLKRRRRCTSCDKKTSSSHEDIRRVHSFPHKRLLTAPAQFDNTQTRIDGNSERIFNGVDSALRRNYGGKFSRGDTIERGGNSRERHENVTKQRNNSCTGIITFEEDENGENVESLDWRNRAPSREGKTGSNSVKGTGTTKTEAISRRRNNSCTGIITFEEDENGENAESLDWSKRAPSREGKTDRSGDEGNGITLSNKTNGERRTNNSCIGIITLQDEESENGLNQETSDRNYTEGTGATWTGNKTGTRRRNNSCTGIITLQEGSENIQTEKHVTDRNCVEVADNLKKKELETRRRKMGVVIAPTLENVHKQNVAANENEEITRRKALLTRVETAPVLTCENFQRENGISDRNLNSSENRKLLAGAGTSRSSKNGGFTRRKEPITRVEIAPARLEHSEEPQNKFYIGSKKGCFAVEENDMISWSLERDLMIMEEEIRHDLALLEIINKTHAEEFNNENLAEMKDFTGSSLVEFDYTHGRNIHVNFESEVKDALDMIVENIREIGKCLHDLDKVEEPQQELRGTLSEPQPQQQQQQQQQISVLNDDESLESETLRMHGDTIHVLKGEV